MSPSTAARARVALAVTAILLAGLDLGVKAAAEQTLADGRVVDLGPLQLRLGYNPGVSFSLGDTLPGWVLLTGSGLIAAALVIFAWRTAPTAAGVGRTGLAAILAGATANLTDRAVNGVVTDYLHTGWFPTFQPRRHLHHGGGHPARRGFPPPRQPEAPPGRCPSRLGSGAPMAGVRLAQPPKVRVVGSSWSFSGRPVRSARATTRSRPRASRSSARIHCSTSATMMITMGMSPNPPGDLPGRLQIRQRGTAPGSLQAVNQSGASKPPDCMSARLKTVWNASQTNRTSARAG